MCQAIHFAHGRGVIHRDIKPQNIILGRHGETLVLDWGLAKATGKADPLAPEEIVRLNPQSGSSNTAAGSLVGTPGFASPEQVNGDLDQIGPRSDVYSLGATLYQLLTGEAPFAGMSRETVLRAVREGQLLPPRQRNPGIAKPLEAICLKAMSLNPSDRYGSARCWPMTSSAG